jgi:hypothetical protein
MSLRWTILIENSFFLFHAALVPMLCLRASPGSHDVGAWVQDVNTVKFLLETSFATYALAQRCLDVINQLLSHGAANNFSPSQLDFSFTESGLESWFDWPGVGGDMLGPSFGPAG